MDIQTHTLQVAKRALLAELRAYDELENDVSTFGDLLMSVRERRASTMRDLAWVNRWLREPSD